MRFHSQPVCDDRYIKTKKKTFNEIPKERNHYICIAAICIDSITKIDILSKIIRRFARNNVNKR